MRPHETPDNAALLISCLPAADAEQLLQRMPEQHALVIRQQMKTEEAPPAVRLAAARRFIHEMSQMRPHGVHLRIDDSQRPASFHFLARQLPSRLASVLAQELPQTTATVLSILPASKAADVLSLLPEDYQVDVVHHVLCSGPVTEDVLSDLADSLVDLVSRDGVGTCLGRQGRERLAELLQCTDAVTRQRLIDAARCEGIELSDIESAT